MGLQVVITSSTDEKLARPRISALTRASITRARRTGRRPRWNSRGAAALIRWSR
jgi:hypothetical protein